MQLNGSQIFVEVLCEQGVDTLFGYPGGAVLNLYDELYKNSDRITHVLTAHEQGAAHAADGYARATGRTGVVLATSGPGATNLVTGIATAYMDSVPMVAFTGNVTTDGIGRDSFQEAYIEGITMPITKHNFTVRRVEELADTMRSAFRIAQSGRKGPVLVDIPKDVTAAVCEFTPKKPEPIRTVTTFNAEQVKWAADLINAAQRPLVYFGGGVRSAASCQPLRDLLHKAEIPATYTLMAAGVVPYGDPMNIGMVGMHGCYTSNRAVADCDVLIAVGTRFSDRVALNPKTFAKNATIIQIDIDPSELGKNVEVDLSIVGDAAYVLNAMLPQIEEKKHPDWMKMIREWQAQDYHPVSDPTRLMPHQVIGEVCNQCGPEAVYVTDVGQHQMWAAQYLRHAKSRGFITSGGLGTMGFGYGAAIGAQMALGRDQRVVMFTGDGSFHMNLNEACTAVSYELPIITVIFNNSVLGMVRQWQTTFYEKRYSQTDPHRKTDFVKLAEGFGLKGYRCTNLPEFQTAFADAMKQKGPTWIECIIDKDEKVLPMIPSGGDINDIIMESGGHSNMESNKRRVISLLVDNQSGVLARVSNLFCRRGFNIDSLTVSATNDPAVSRITVTITSDDKALKQLILQTERLEVTRQVFVLDGEKSLERELLLLKVASDVHNRSELREIASIYKAKIIDLSPDSMVFELIGKPDKIDAFLKMFTDYKILEQCRTGVTALERGGMHQHMQKPPQEVREAQLPLPGTHCPERK